MSQIKRFVVLPDCPPQFISNAPEGYSGNGICALVFAGTIDNLPPTAWAEGLGAQLGLTPEVAATITVKWIPAYLWTAFWDPTGQAVPPLPPNE